MSTDTTMLTRTSQRVFLGHHHISMLGKSFVMIFLCMSILKYLDALFRKIIADFHLVLKPLQVKWFWWVQNQKMPSYFAHSQHTTVYVMFQIITIVLFYDRLGLNECISK